MGQDITCLITDQPVELDKNIVHFKINDVLFIPFGILGLTISWFIEEAKNYDTAQELFNYFKGYQSDDPDNMDLSCGEDEKHTILDIIKLIEDHSISNFIIEHTSDFADMPVDDYFLAIANGKIIKDSIVCDEREASKKNYAHIKKYREQIGLDFNWIGMDQFHSYRFAEQEYFK